MLQMETYLSVFQTYCALEDFSLVVRGQHGMCGLGARYEFEPLPQQKPSYLSGEGQRGYTIIYRVLNRIKRTYFIWI